MEISKHAVDNYISRVIGIDQNQAGESIRDRARDKIEETVKRPEITYKENGEKYPIEIKGAVAVPVGKDPDGTKYVPTAYRSSTFLDNGDNNE